jgi:mercuric transport protein
MRGGIAPWIATILALLLAHAALGAPSTVVLAVEGMTWGSWPVTVKRALEGLKGVLRAEVSFRDKQARVTFDRDQVSVEQLIDAVNRLGFRASLKAAEPAR